MPWKPSYSESQARDAIRRSRTWSDVLRALGCGYHGKNISTLRKWAERWGISVEHLPPRSPRPVKRRTYTETEAREAVRSSYSWAEALRRLGYCHTGANPTMLKRRARDWAISTDHFDPYAASRGRRPKIPLAEILVNGSTYSRNNLKGRLYRAGLKRPVCELCGQGEIWRGKRIGLILDHINGVRNDNRIENLRIVCPNCAATLETHCGRKNRTEPIEVPCDQCGARFRPRYRTHRFCSQACWHLEQRARGRKLRGVPKPSLRRVERPSYEMLAAEIDEFGYVGVSRKYGVTDNAVRKWMRQYERERALAEGRDPSAVQIPRRTWPNRRRNEEAA